MMFERPEKIPVQVMMVIQFISRNWCIFWPQFLTEGVRMNIC